MTLIAATYRDKRLVIMGDTMLSGGFDQLNMPNIGGIWREEYLRILQMRAPDNGGLCQKIHILSDHVCAGWTGKYVPAKAFLTELCDCVGRPGEEWNLATIIETAFAKRKEDFDYIVLSKEENNVRIFTTCTDYLRYGYDRVIAGGTGKNYIIDMIPKVNNDPSGINQIDDALSGLALCTAAMTHQMQSGEGLREAWGAFFETAVISGNAFEKITDVLWLEWWMIETEPDVYIVKLAPEVFFSSYINFDLVVNAIDLKHRFHRRFTIKPCVLPRDGMATSRIWSGGIMFLANMVPITRLNKTFDAKSIVNVNKVGKVEIQFHKGRLGIYMDKIFVDTMRVQLSLNFGVVSRMEPFDTYVDSSEGWVVGFDPNDFG